MCTPINPTECCCCCVNLFKEDLKLWVQKHFSYIKDAGDKLEDLKTELEPLIATKDTVEVQISNDLQDGKVVAKNVQQWLLRVKNLQLGLESVSSKYESRSWMLGRCSFNCFTTHYVGKQADKLKQSALKEMNLYDTMREAITVEAPAPAVQQLPAVSLGETGRRVIQPKVDEALRFLRDDTKAELGIYGMGGVGKTTLLIEINNELGKDDLSFGFDYVIFLTASQTANEGTLQQQIAKRLKLTTNGDCSTNVFNFLKARSFVLLMDDVWKKLDLKIVGIPTPFGIANGKNRKLIITTRDHRVCNQMQIQHCMPVNCFSKKNARLLFREIAGPRIDSSNTTISKLVNQVADECDGLPLALVAMAGVMPQGQNVDTWRAKVKRIRLLKSQQLTGTTNTYLPILRSSYSFLEAQEQQCLLLCALWPEGSNIPEDDLINCWIAHGLLGNDIVNAYGEGHIMIDFLQQASLVQLVQTNYNKLWSKSVKLHDLIREMALWIAGGCGDNNNKWLVREGASQQDAQLWSQANKISLFGVIGTMLPRVCENQNHFTNLDTFMIQSNGLLKVDDIKIVQYFSSLKYLNLSHCDLEGFPNEICQLSTLEFLNLSYIWRIDSVPEGLANLTGLKYLLLRNTRIFELPQGLLSALGNLLVLDLHHDHSFHEGLSRSLILQHSDCLNSHLKVFGIDVHKPTDLTKLVDQLSNVSIWYLRISGMQWASPLFNLSSGDCLGKEHMRSSMKELIIEFCSFKKIQIDANYDLPCLETLVLRGMEEIIWNGVNLQSVFPMLRVLHIDLCPLNHLSWAVCLSSLEFLKVEKCEFMEQLVLECTHPAAFQKLRILQLWDLDKLRGISDSEVQFPSLEELSVYACHVLKKLPFATLESCPKLKKIYDQDRLLLREEAPEKINMFKHLF